VHREYRVESLPASVFKVGGEILDHLTELGYEDKDLFNIRLIVDELCSNAVIHGNGSDPEKMLTIRLEADSRKARIAVEDEGEGFDYTAVQDPRDDHLLRRPHGRGLFLIRTFADEVEFRDPGNCITITYIRGKHEKQKVIGLHSWILNDVVVFEVLDRTTPEIAESLLREAGQKLSEGLLLIIVDLRRCREAESEFVSALSRLNRDLRDRGGRLAVCQKKVAPVFRSDAKIGDPALEIVEDLDDALRRLGQRK